MTMTDDVRDPPAICPECEQGKHDNCTGDVLVDDLVWEPCECPVCRATS